MFELLRNPNKFFWLFKKIAKKSGKIMDNIIEEKVRFPKVNSSIKDSSAVIM